MTFTTVATTRWFVSSVVTTLFTNFATMDGTVDEPFSRKKRSPEQRNMARVASKAAFGGMPVLTLVGHLTLVDADGITAGVTVFGKGGIETVQAERASVSHDVPFTAQLSIAFKTTEMPHVPRSTFSFCTFIGKNYLITRCASRFKAFGVVSSTIEFSVFEKVDEVYQEFLADAAGKAAGVPARVGAGSRCEHGHITLRDGFITVSTRLLLTELLQGASAQGFLLPLLREQAQLFPLVLMQGVAIPHLVVVRRELM